MSLEEAILDKLRHLPPSKQEEVLRFADGLQRQPIPRAVPARDRKREMKWIADNRSAYAGQWVAFSTDGTKILASHPDPGGVTKIIDDAGIGATELLLRTFPRGFRDIQDVRHEVVAVAVSRCCATTTPAVLSAVSYRDRRRGQPRGRKLSAQRSLIRKDGNLTVRPSCDGQHQGRWEPGLCGTVNSGEALLNVVT